MPRLLQLQGTPSAGNGRRVFLAIPTYGPLPAPVAYAMVATERALTKAGIGCHWAILSGHCHVDDARNELIAEFLTTDCQDLVFIDADVQWRPDDLVRMLSYDLDIVGGLYRKKQTDEEYPYRPEGWAEEKDGTIEVGGLPAGFMRIRRKVLETLRDASTSYMLDTADNGTRQVWTMFERMTVGASRFSGDFAFCHKAIKAGFRIYADTLSRFAHIGEQSWTGSFGAWLHRKTGKTLFGLREIAAGTEAADTFQQLYDEWDNDGFAATPELLMAATWMAREAKGPILETGSGLTTLCMAAANPGIEVHALEHSVPWGERLMEACTRFGLTNVVLHIAPLVQQGTKRWYDTLAFSNRPWALVLCDGPPRAKGDRSALFDHVVINGCPVLMDDADDYKQLGMLEEWSKDRGRTVTMLGVQRRFAVSTEAPCAT